MSEVKVNKISPRTACGTVTLGDSGDTFTIPSGATITNAGTASGFGATGETSWDTTVKTTGTFTATAGVGYFLNTTGGIITVNLPVGSAGSSVAMTDYAGTWQTNNVTVAANGSEKIGGIDANATLSTEGQSVTFVYIDATQGWVNVLDSTSNVRGISPYIMASGGNTTITCGDYKTHIFTGPGSFTVCRAGSPVGSNGTEYIVVAGGGGGGNGCAGGSGGAGGMLLRTVCGSASPLNAPAPLQVTTDSSPYSITVGGAGPGAPSSPPGSGSLRGGAGSNSIFSTITAAGGGYGAAGSGSSPLGNGGGAGGSGGGGGHSLGTAGAGNTPATTPPQGFAGGTSVPSGDDRGGGGGGAAATSAPPTNIGGAGSYIPTTFIGPTAPSYGETGPEGRFFAGGAGGSVRTPSSSPTGGVGGLGGGGDGITGPSSGNCGVINTGGGGSAGASPSASAVGGGSGGTGIVIIRYKFQN